MVWLKPKTVQDIPQAVLDARKPDTTDPKYLKPSGGDEAIAPNLVIFIHGIFGDTVQTWQRVGGYSLWDYVARQPDIAKDFDAYAFGFPSKALQSGSFNVPEAAKTLYTDVIFRQFLKKYKRIIIVAHSLGGLVALEALTTYDDLRAAVPLVVTYGTPWEGAQLTTIGHKVLDNPAIGDMFPEGENNSLLESLANRWKQKTPRGKVVCAYETVPLPVFGLIVPKTSGSALCDVGADAIAENHFDIVKPDRQDHTSVKVLINALRSLPALDAEIPDTPATGHVDYTRQVDFTRLHCLTKERKNDDATIYTDTIKFLAGC